MVGGCKILAVIASGVVFCTAAHADMVSVVPGSPEHRVSPQVCAAAQARSIVTPNLFAWADSPAFDPLVADVSPQPADEGERVSGTQPLRVLSDGQGSFGLCLYALMGLGLCRSGSWVRRLSIDLAPDWYHGGGPQQIGRSFAISSDCCPAFVCCFLQPECMRQDSPLRYRAGTVVALWRHFQFTPLVLASPGPPEKR